MCDKLVFDLAQEIEGTPSVFVRKEWINILDNQNQNYSSNQSVIDTSQLSNSNKYMSYREGYLLVPLTLTIQGQENGAVGLKPVTVGGSDQAFGLKNWFGQIIHSFTLDYNGTTIIQQTPFVNMWNSFKLMTSLSYGDVMTQGQTIGFYPDDPLSWTFAHPVTPAGATDGQIQYGQGVSNSIISPLTGLVAGNIGTDRSTQYSARLGNLGYLKRQLGISYDPKVVDIPAATDSIDVAGQTSYFRLLGRSGIDKLWKSVIYHKQDTGAGNNAIPVIQCAVTATIYLKHLHSFFNMVPLLKGVFMKMTMNLNNSTSTIVAGWKTRELPVLLCSETNNAIGGVFPGLVSGGYSTSLKSQSITGLTTAAVQGPPAIPALTVTGAGSLQLATGGSCLFPTYAADNDKKTYKYNISVGNKCLDQSMISKGSLTPGPLAQSIYLYVPAYTFNPVFEQAYLSSPVKQIKYTDIYQYQVENVGGQSQFNNLVTNGIANIKSILILPYYSHSGQSTVTVAYLDPPYNAVTVSSVTGLRQGLPVYQSPFDTAGCCTTSPLAHLTNFNVQVSGQNAIYNLQKYGFEQFNHQLYGQNAVNGGLTDGLTSGLIDRLGFDMAYCYYYVDLSRMLPVEQSVPKSIQIVGEVASQKALNLFCFIEYGAEVSIDILTGSRV